MRKFHFRNTLLTCIKNSDHRLDNLFSTRLLQYSTAAYSLLFSSWFLITIWFHCLLYWVETCKLLIDSLNVKKFRFKRRVAFMRTLGLGPFNYPSICKLTKLFVRFICNHMYWYLIIPRKWSVNWRWEVNKTGYDTRRFYWVIKVSKMAVESTSDDSATEVIVLILSSVAVLLVVTHPRTRDTALLSVRPEALHIQILKV